MINAAARIYLILTPFVAAILAFTFGHSSYKVYLPLWFVHACLMIFFTSRLAIPGTRSKDAASRRLVTIAWLLILPWMLMSVFAGMGPLPATLQEWVDSETEQHIRYIILIVSGLIFISGFNLLRDALKKQGESLWSSLAFTAFLIKIVLFILDMNYLGGFMIASIKSFVASGAPANRPEWYIAAREQFAGNSFVEVAVTYLGTAAFAAAFQIVGWIRPAAARTYIVISFIGLACSLLPTSATGALGVASYLSSIPAFSLIMPYLMGVRLLTVAGQNLKVVR